MRYLACVCAVGQPSAKRLGLACGWCCCCGNSRRRSTTAPSHPCSGQNKPTLCPATHTLLTSMDARAKWAGATLLLTYQFVCACVCAGELAFG